MRRTKTEKIDTLVKKIMEDYAKQGDNYQHLIYAEWKQMLGVTVTNATRKIYIKERKLFVHLDSPIIKQELILLKDKIIQHMNRKFPDGQLENIIFK
ncbi:uncharacterized protein DUF721 [Balneicella halophila]|uniref:Uncharacterized protein DUF721 n=1 Tax=Balneicella halophila TaxID=1537566 RepID=A0A7L4URX0_BALHA|nr:DciA family protein [Balneicella halophila]PVX51069.1 uncharacterized protein DUF721 [Balneicella halophila]